jgi:hypothetical protein
LTSSLTTRQDLAKIKSRAIRTRIWYKALSRIERGILDLTIRCVDEVRSNTLSRTITTIIGKILQCYEERFLAKAETAGRKIAQTICDTAARWGNPSCSSWKRDKHFLIFLGINALNT